MRKPTFIELGEMKVAGIGIRTTNQQQSDGNNAIGELWQRYYQDGIQDRTPDRLDPDVVVGVYSGYESDENGAYDLLIGSAVPPETDLPQELSVVTIPAGTYAVFTSRRGPLVDVVVEAWGHVWEWTRQSGNKRTFTADFERYDRQNCADPSNAQIKLYIACEPGHHPAP
ncbi:GyrI-like domain-containing protein [Brevibacillus choshinensis]|uniref:AraC family transcriptional regulator n=1 Tax=Brevibacillus choshinensis TaxID=54911 RepID=A0ABX7FVC2_BRECH|nr:GyrI-like domain-containing protein [Brevibacillus choshinensis]QRG70061.1 AraC family transcriptional regulator [Brevibacillus choshinensis]